MIPRDLYAIMQILSFAHILDSSARVNFIRSGQRDYWVQDAPSKGENNYSAASGHTS